MYNCVVCTVSQGDIGIKGSKGDSGPAGLEGSKGCQGITGPTGMSGKAGPTGKKVRTFVGLCFSEKLFNKKKLFHILKYKY